MSRLDDLIEGVFGPTPGAAIAVPDGHGLFAGRESVDTEGTQSFTVPTGTPLDTRVSFVVGSVIVDNNTSAWINIPDATKDGTGRFVPPGGAGAIPILGHISRARANWTAPPGRVQPAFVAGEQAVLIFVASPVPPGFGIANPSPVARWNILALPATGGQATATKAAAAGVTHVADAPSFGMAQSSGASSIPIALIRDGPSGSGAAIFQQLMAVSVTVGDKDHIEKEQMSLRGTAGNAMTVEFNTAIAGVNEAVNLVGYDL